MQHNDIIPQEEANSLTHSNKRSPIDLEKENSQSNKKVKRERSPYKSADYKHKILLEKTSLAELHNKINDAIERLLQARKENNKKPPIEFASRLLKTKHIAISKHPLPLYHQTLECLWIIAFILSEQQLHQFFDSNQYNRMPIDFANFFYNLMNALNEDQKKALSDFMIQKQSAKEMASRIFEQTRKFFDAIPRKQLPIHTWATAPNSPITESDSSVIPLYPHQSRALEHMINPLQDGLKTNGWLHMATGTGKTLCFTYFCLATSLRTLILVPTLDLAEQTKHSLVKVMQSFQLHKDIKIFSGSRLNNRCGEDITITTYDSFNNQLKLPPIYRKLKIDAHPLLILDEAHHALTFARAGFIQYLFNHHLVYGVSATDTYICSGRKHGFLKTITELFHQPALLGYPIQQAIHDGILSPTKVVLIKPPVQLDTEEKDGEQQLVKEHKSRLSKAENINIVADFYMHRIDPITSQSFLGQPMVVNCISIKHAEEVARSFNENFARLSSSSQYTAASITSKTTTENRKKIMHQFSTKQITVLTGANLLVEGIDYPGIIIALNLSPSFSLRVAQQRGGRAIRKLSDYEFTQIKYVVDVYWASGQITFDQIAGGHYIEANIPKNNERKNKHALAPFSSDGLSNQIERIPSNQHGIEHVHYDIYWNGNFDIVKTQARLPSQSRFREPQQIPYPAYPSQLPPHTLHYRQTAYYPTYDSSTLAFQPMPIHRYNHPARSDNHSLNVPPIARQVNIAPRPRSFGNDFNFFPSLPIESPSPVTETVVQLPPEIPETIAPHMHFPDLDLFTLTSPTLGIRNEKEENDLFQIDNFPSEFSDFFDSQEPPSISSSSPRDDGLTTEETFNHTAVTDFDFDNELEDDSPHANNRYKS